MSVVHLYASSVEAFTVTKSANFDVLSMLASDMRKYSFETLPASLPSPHYHRCCFTVIIIVHHYNVAWYVSSTRQCNAQVSPQSYLLLFSKLFMIACMHDAGTL